MSEFCSVCQCEQLLLVSNLTHSHKLAAQGAELMLKGGIWFAVGCRRGHGWGIRLPQVVLHGCVPVIIQDYVYQVWPK